MSARGLRRLLLGRGAALLSLAHVTDAQGGAFAFQSTQYAVGDRPSECALGDLTGDASPDLVVANSGSHDLAVLLGTGLGSFGSAAFQPVGLAPSSVGLGDLDGDGHLDAAVTLGRADQVAILLGDGTGSLVPVATYPAQAGPRHLELTDFDQDGRQDFATANVGSRSVSVRYGLGGAYFGPEWRYAFHDYLVQRIDVGDVDGDGRSDIAVGLSYPAEVLGLLLNAGVGFSPGESAPILQAGTAEWVALGDVDADGDLDFQITNRDFDFACDVLFETRLGLGDGTFCCAQYVLGGCTSRANELFDLDADGLLDHASLTSTSLRLLHGSGNGTFAVGWTSLPVGAAPFSISAGDADLDGHLDLAVASRNADVVTVFVNAL